MRIYIYCSWERFHSVRSIIFDRDPFDGDAGLVDLGRFAPHWGPQTSKVYDSAEIPGVRIVGLVVGAVLLIAAIRSMFGGKR